MNITIFGATDLLGKYLVRQALALDNTVYAFGRNVFVSGFAKNESLHLLQGTLFDEHQVLNAIRNSDSIIAVINSPSDEFDKSRSLGIKNIVKQMQTENIKRLIVVGSIAVMEDESGDLLMEHPDFPVRDIETGKEDLEVLKILKSSNLNWTFVALPPITDADVTGLYQIEKNNLPINFDKKIKAGDAGLFILNELNKSENSATKVAIYN